ncbi:MAG: hypothetical protein AB1806_14980 [Acidobacteriota bacterium]
MRQVSMPLVLLCVALTLDVSPGLAQTPSANAADVASVDSIITALYGVISGPAGQARDWDRFRNLFAPGARLIPAAPRRDGAAPVALSPDDYVQRTSESFMKNGFFETEIARTTDGFGTVVHVFSTYESRRTKDDPKPLARGINSIQVMQHAGRWWIVTVMWDQERADNPIPAKYLAKR